MGVICRRLSSFLLTYPGRCGRNSSLALSCKRRCNPIGLRGEVRGGIIGCREGGRGVERGGEREYYRAQGVSEGR